jgi:hypothetical protein
LEKVAWRDKIGGNGQGTRPIGRCYKASKRFEPRRPVGDHLVEDFLRPPSFMNKGINFPAAIAQAMEFAKGETVEWVIQDQQTLQLRRLRPAGAAGKKTLGLLANLAGLLEDGMDACAQHRTAWRAWRLGLSQLACLGRHTVTGLLGAAGRQGCDWSADYRFFAQDRWRVEGVFAPVLKGMLELDPAHGPFVAAMDDTLLRKSGAKTPGVA